MGPEARVIIIGDNQSRSQRIGGLVKKVNRRRKKPATSDRGASSGQIRTTVVFGGEGVPLEFLWTVKEAAERQHRTLMDRLQSVPSPGFVPIMMARYVELHLAANPGTDREQVTTRLSGAVEASKSGTRCRCGSPIWVIGSAEAGIGCFTCLTGEATPDGDYEIDEVLV
jgi:hypothetical protein